MDEAEDRQAGGTEEAGEREVNTGNHAVEHVGAHVLHRERLHDRILREQREERRGDELEQDREEEPDAAGDADAIPECLPRTCRVAGTDGLRRDRRYGRQHAGRHQEEEADRFLDDADRRRDVDATPVRDHRNNQKRNLDETVLARDREANAENLLQHRRVPPGAAIRAGMFMKSFRLPDADKRERHRRCLRHNRCERCTRCAQLHWPHEEKVEQDVEGTGHGDEKHRTAAVPHAAEDRAQDVVRDDEGDAGEADAEVREGPWDGFGRCRQQLYDRLCESEQGQCCGRGDHREEGDGVSDRASDAVVVLCTDEAADHDGGAHGKADDHDGHHVHDLRTDRNRRDDIRAVEATRDEQIGEPVECLQEVAQQIRE